MVVCESLFEEVLIKPIHEFGANKLFIVSGYATALMANRHFDYVKGISRMMSVDLIVGMCSQDGLERKNHILFQELQNNAKFDFKCNYITNTPSVHSKVYAWFKDDEPVIGYVGSANYTQNAFSGSIRETLTEVSAVACRDYHAKLLGETINCTDENVEDAIAFYDKVSLRASIENSEILTSFPSQSNFELEQVTLSLLDRDGNVPARSGLNWGQRIGRDKNQAYLSVTAEVGRSDFFPARYSTFTVVTDDDKQLICVRAQDNGKAIHTTLNNSWLGEYFRNRLGVASGTFITKDILLKYGRTDVTFYKIDDESYYMDFSVH